MAQHRYRFDAPPGHTFVVGDRVFEAGEELKLEEAIAVDSRLTDLGPVSEAKTQPEETETEDEAEDSEELDQVEDVSEGKATEQDEAGESETAFGLPRR